MWSNMRIRGKILTGIGIVILINVIASSFSAVNFFRVSKDVEYYNHAVEEAGLAAVIESDFLKYSTDVMDYVRSPREEMIAETTELAKHLREFIGAARELIDDPSHLEKVQEISDAFDAYEAQFIMIQEQLAKQVMLVEDLVGTEGTGAKLIADIQEIGRLTGSMTFTAAPAAVAAGNEARDAQLFSSRTFGLRDDKYASQTVEVLDSLAAHLSDLEAGLSSDEGQALVAESKELLALFRKEFDLALDAQKQLDQAINVDLRKLQDIVVKDVEWLESESVAYEHKIKKEVEEIILQSEILVIALAIGGLVLGVIAGIFIGNNVSRPIIGMNAAMARLADSDWSVDIPGADRGDEIGEMSASVQVFKDKGMEAERLRAEQAEAEMRQEEEKRKMMNDLADSFDRSVGGVVETVSSAATELEASSQTVASAAEETSHQSTTVASAAEQASANVQSVSSASEELTASIGEISSQVTRSTEASASAVTDVENATIKVQGLSNAANKIGEVIAMITEIAEQTNLLALNATIESARAGEAGKGFAVVASEVKTLANQTSKATEEIAAQIQDIQSATKESVSAIESIGDSIHKLDQINSTIAAAMEEQSAATAEIARNVEEAATGTSEVSRNIIQVTEAAGESGRVASDMQSAAAELSEQSNVLKVEVEKFLTQIRT